jgi:hypothetical protein
MQPTSNDIEQIIRVVMQRLAAAGDFVSGVGAIADPSADSDLVLTDRVVTLKTLEGKLSGKRRLRVHPRAVVTPAVADELRKAKVELVRDGASSAIRTHSASDVATTVSAKPIIPHHAPVLVCGSAVWFNSLPRHLCPKQATVSQCDDSAAVDLIKQHKARGGQRSIWLTATPFAASVAVARANCCTAVLLPNLGELKSALEQANPECVIVDASRFTVAAIGNLVRGLLKHPIIPAGQA